MLEAFHARARLTPAERRVFDDKLLEGLFSPDDLLSQLNTQIELVRAGQRSSQALKQAIIICSVFAALVCVPALILDPNWLSVPGGLVVIAIVLALARRKLRPFSVPSQVPATAYPFLTVLKHDLAASEPLRVRLDLSAPTAPAKRGTVSAPYMIRAYKVVDTTYIDAWFNGEARLADGSHLRWSVTDALRVSERRRPKTRGRVKRKTSYYKTSEIEVSVSFPTKLYRLEDVPNVAGQKVSVKQSERRCTLTVKRVAKIKSQNPLEPRQLLDPIAVAFRAAKPVRGAA